MTDAVVTLTQNISGPTVKGLYERIVAGDFGAGITWFQTNPALVTKDPTSAAVSAVNPKVGTGISYLQGTTSSQPIFWESQFGGFPGFKFDGVDDRLITAWTGAPSRSGVWGMAVVFRLPAPSAQVTVLGSWTSSNVGTLVYVTTGGALYVQHGTGLLACGSVSYGKPIVLLFGSDGDNLFARVNGKDYASIAHNNAASTQGWVLGSLNSAGAQPFNGSLGDVIFLPFVPSLNLDFVDAIESYSVKHYGAPMAWL